MIIFIFVIGGPYKDLFLLFNVTYKRKSMYLIYTIYWYFIAIVHNIYYNMCTSNYL